MKEVHTTLLTAFNFNFRLQSLQQDDRKNKLLKCLSLLLQKQSTKTQPYTTKDIPPENTTVHSTGKFICAQCGQTKV